jgi:adhesin transport system outer membrane protein
MSKKAWETQRKQRVGANLAEITLTLDKMSITADAKKATATFAQHYASGKYSDDVMKVLSFENVNGQWLIVKESAR